MTSTFKHFVETHHVFTTDELRDACSYAPSTATALSRAAADGRVEKVRNGLYTSNTGRFAGAAADPYLVAATFDSDAVFSYHSALELHGLAHTLSTRVQFRSTAARLTFRFKGITYERYPSKTEVASEAIRADSYGEARVTSREQTFLDCMCHMRLCGGAEEVLHSLAGLPYLRLDLVEELLSAHPASATARAGWYLEENAQRWNVSDDLLIRLEKRLPKNASYYLDSSARKGAHAFSSRWKLNLPAPHNEINTWMEL